MKHALKRLGTTTASVAQQFLVLTIFINHEFNPDL